MEQKDKDLLLQDLCARLPYKVKASYYGAAEECECWDEVEGIVNDYVEIGQYSLPIEAVKPYLFPLSSMTEEQKTELCKLAGCDNVPCSALEWRMGGCLDSYDFDFDFRDMSLTIDWLNKNHFDYRGLIEKGLAIDATNLNIY